MATAAQYTANRANAQHSTGPTTPAGIQQTKQNATRHGLTGKQIVIKGENPAEYDAVHNALIDQHQPATELEAMLVEEIAQNWWRLERAKKVESQVIDLYGLLECTIDPDARKSFQTISRYLTGIERAWRRACTELAKLQQARCKSEEEIGSVSQSEIPASATTPQPSNPNHQHAPRPTRAPHSEPHA